MYSRIIETKIDVVTEGELTIEYQTLVNKAKEQVLKAYAPYSGFHVGAALMLANGEVFAGSNQENAAYPSGLCAERVAMFYANAQYPNVPVKAIAIVAYTADKFLSSPITPCGSCRQVLLESEMRFDNDIEVILYGTDEIYILKNIRQLMPLCFEKSSLNK